MKLGCIAPGVIRTFRYFRGCEVVKNKNNEFRIVENTKGGISFLFQLDYNKNELLFTAAITLEEDNFNFKEGKSICIARAVQSSAPWPFAPMSDSAFKLPLNAEVPLLEQVFNALQLAKELGQLKNNKFLSTLLKRMEEYNDQYGEAEDLMDQLVTEGLIQS